MKFSKETLRILKNFSNINPSIYLQKGKTLTTCHIDKYSFSSAVIEEEIKDDIGIYDLNNFLSLIDLMGEAEIEYHAERSELVISNGNSTLYYTTASPNTIVYPNSQPTLPAPSVVFDIKADHLIEMNRVVRAMSIDVLSFESDDGHIYLRGYNTSSDQKLNRVLYSIKLAENNTTVEFKSTIRVSNLKILDLDYSVLLILQEGGGAISFQSDQNELKYVVVLEKTSTFEN